MRTKYREDDAADGALTAAKLPSVEEADSNRFIIAIARSLAMVRMVINSSPCRSIDRQLLEVPLSEVDIFQCRKEKFHATIRHPITSFLPPRLLAS